MPPQVEVRKSADKEVKKVEEVKRFERRRSIETRKERSPRVEEEPLTGLGRAEMSSIHGKLN